MTAAPLARAFMAGASGVAFELDRDGGWIHTVHNGRRVHSVTAIAPSAQATSADGCFLYVAHGVTTYRGLPAGAVSSYRIEKRGRLTLLNTQALSLAAIAPHHVAISHDGSMLAIAAAEGGILNLLPLSQDGFAMEVVAAHRRLNAVMPVNFSFAPDGMLRVDRKSYGLRDGRFVLVGA